MKLGFDVEATCGEARAGTVTLPRGTFQTPVFMPVGTRGTVRALTVDQLEMLGAQIILGNTYHLMLRPGAALIEDLGGLHRFEDWHGRMLTDSGGFQVFSLEPKVDDDGVTFKSVYDGSSHRFTPETAVRLQEQIGADIAMVLDVCPPLPSSIAVIRKAMDRTSAWAAIQREAHRRDDQVQFGIVQGGIDLGLRAEHAARITEVGFDGYAIGGLSVGESKADMFPAIAATNEVLPKDRPRYLMGVGDPLSLVEGIARGIDMFDCVLPTRLARHGTVLTSAGKLQIRNAAFARDDRPLDGSCSCPTCVRHSRAYLRHLQSIGEQTAATLLTIHNLAFLLGLMARVRASIIDGSFERVRAEVLEVWGPI